MTGKLLLEALRIVFCSSERRFKEIWGEELGGDLWSRFREKYKGDVAKFLCEEVRDGQIESLSRYTLKELGLQVSTNGAVYHLLRVNELIDGVMAREKLSAESQADLGYVRIYASEANKPKINPGMTLDPGHVLGAGLEDD